MGLQRLQRVTVGYVRAILGLYGVSERNREALAFKGLGQRFGTWACLNLDCILRSILKQELIAKGLGFQISP